MDTTQLPNLLDLQKLQRGAGYDLIAEAVTALRPEIMFVPAATMTGTAMELTVLKGLPTVAFRLLNEGTAKSKPMFENRIFQCGIIDQPIQCDRRSPELAGANRGNFLANFSFPFVEAALNHICAQFYYGVKNDAKGFIGLIAQSNPATEFVVDATDNTALSSVWFLTNGRAKLEWLYGDNQTITMGNQWLEETAYDANQAAFPALTNWLKGRPGLRVADKRAAIRIKNIGTTGGKGLTDTLMYQALRKANDLGMNPTEIVMNSRSREQLRASRVTVQIPAPELPKEFEGIPIKVTSAISNAETI